MKLEEALALANELVFAKSGVYLSDLQQALLRESWSWQRQSYDQIADAYGYSPTYLKHDIGPKLWKLLSEALGEKVTKTSFRAAIERHQQAGSAVKTTANSVSSPSSPPSAQASSQPIPSQLQPITHQDWGDAVDVGFFWGRQPELVQLEQWIVQEKCRLVSIVGMGGMGKSSLSVVLAQQLQSQFEFVIWRSLRNAPPLSETLSDLLQFLFNEQQIDFTETETRKITRLVNHLRSHRCLIILDNVETILQDRNLLELSPSEVNDQPEEYNQFFKRLGESQHQSCVILTSREKPQAVAVLEGAMLPVRSLQLQGVSEGVGREIFNLKGAFQASATEWQQIIQRYSGNPLALKIVSTTVQKLFDGNISEFLAQDAFILDGIRSLLSEQFKHLPDLEKMVLYWLAINREPVAFAALRADLHPPLPAQQLINALESLEQRSLIEKVAACFSLQPVVMEYVTDELVKRIGQEMIDASSTGTATRLQLFRNLSLIKAQANDYVREAQTRFILQPVLEKLTDWVTGDRVTETVLRSLLATIRDQATCKTGYAGGNLLNLLCLLQPVIQDWDFSHLSIWQAYLQNATLHNVDFTHCDFTHSVFTETFSVVFSVAFSPEGQFLATGDARGELRLWQTADRKPLIAYEGHKGWIWSVVFSPDRRTLASCSNDRTVKIWEIETGKCLRILEDTGSVWSVAFNRTGEILASGGDEPVVKRWNTVTESYLNTLEGHTGRILTVAFSPTDWVLASGSDDHTVRIWNDQTGECLHVLAGHTDRIWSVVFHPNAEILASASADHTIRLWSLQTGDCIAILQGHTDRVRSITFSPDGQLLISGGDDRTIRLWEVNTRQCLKILQGHTNSIFSVALEPDGQILASGSSDQTTRLWNLTTGSCFKSLQGYTNSVFSVAFNQTGDRLVSGSTDHRVRVWDVNAEHCLQVLAGHEGWVLSVAYHPMGHLIASSSADQTVRIWQSSSGRCLHTLRGHTNWVQSVAFSPDGQLLASCGDDRTIRLWELKQGKCLEILTGHESWIWSVHFHPQSHLLVSSGEDQTVRIWDIQTKQCLNILEGHTSRIHAALFSPDGRLIASASDDKTIRLWDVVTGQCTQVLEGHQNNVWSVGFSTDGQTLISISLDQTIRFWRIHTGECYQILHGFTNSIRSSIATNTDANTRFACGSHDGTVQIWKIDAEVPYKTLTPNRPYQGTRMINATGLTLAQKTALKAMGADIDDV